jgi:16S rRNA (cytosine1402-N4)-methyltransferase
MLLEVLEYLVCNPKGIYVDCTFGGGGHTIGLLNKFNNIKIIAIDWDEEALNRYEQLNISGKLNNRVIFIRDNFKNIKKILSNIKIKKVDGILVDVGLSSRQLNNLDRGFSFKANSLDMRMDNRNKITAEYVINSATKEKLANIFYNYGEEYKSKQIAKAITTYRKANRIITAKKLQEIIFSVKRKSNKINSATKVFQSLRIFINKELDNLQNLLYIAPNILNIKGRIIVISFHSLEDRIVKYNFKQNTNNGIYKTLSKKVIRAKKIELKFNNRSRSAKMRIAECLNHL